MATQELDDLENCQQFVEEIDYSEIQRLQIVGEGSFGVVWKGIWRDQYVAVKNITTDIARKAFIVEVRQLSRVEHPNIVKLYGACTKGPNICLVMEYAEGGSLFNVLHRPPLAQYTVAHAMSWALQCARGVAYLHAMQPKALIHRDLKPPNLLLIMGGQILKICDFGTAADKSTYMTNNRGSAAWMAPEVFTGFKYTEKCDVFSWGIILWEILARKKPFSYPGSNAFSIMWAVNKGIRPSLLKNCPKPIEDLMVSCWDAQPANRPNMDKVVEIMTKLSVLFPGADVPLKVEEYQEDYDMPDDGERRTNDESDSDADQEEFFPQTNGIQTTITLPQPPAEYSKALSIDTNEWESLEDIGIQTLPGLDVGMAKQGTTNSIQTVLQNTSTESERTIQEDSNLENMHMLLDPHLRPGTPDLNNPESRKLFEEHKQLAQEFLKIQTEIAYVTKHRDELQASLLTEEQKKRKQNLVKMQNELRDLLSLYKNLQTHLNIDERNPNISQLPEEDWEML